MSPALCMVVLPEYGAQAPGNDSVVERACELVDAEVFRIIPTAYAEIEKLLRGNLPRLGAAAQALPRARRAVRRRHVRRGALCRSA